MYIDFAGGRLEVVDEMTGETKKAEVFVPSFRSVIIPTAWREGLSPSASCETLRDEREKSP